MTALHVEARTSNISKAVARGDQPGQGPTDDRRKGKRAARIWGTVVQGGDGNGLPGTRHFCSARTPREAARP